MRAGFGFLRVKLSVAHGFERRGQAVARGVFVAMLALACVAGTSLAQTPPPGSNSKARAPVKSAVPAKAARVPAKARPAVKVRAPAKSRAPAKTPIPAKPVAPPVPAPQSAPAETPQSQPARAPVDVDVDKLQPFNLPPASRERMHQCGDEWRKLKMAGHSAGLTWRIFAEKCLPR
jgi:hypothetical protein